MNEIIRIGLDTSKYVFQLHGVDAAEQPVLRKPLRRSELERFFRALPPTVVGMEACGAAHHWARVLQGLGHTVKLVPAQYAKMYVKRGKNDAADAEAICEAMNRPTMRFVPVRSAENQAALMLHGVRALLIKERTMLSNALRGHAAEFGIVRAQGGCAGLLRAIAEAGLPEPAGTLLLELGEQIRALDRRLRQFDTRLRQWHRDNALSRRLETIPGVGLISATALAMKVPDPSVFRSARHFAAWLGLTPKDHSTAGKRRLGAITKAGDVTLRCLLVNGAMAQIRFAKPGRASPWLLTLLARKPKKLAAVALANKTARIAWVVMSRNEVYRQPTAA